MNEFEQLLDTAKSLVVGLRKELAIVKEKTQALEARETQLSDREKALGLRAIKINELEDINTARAQNMAVRQELDALKERLIQDRNNQLAEVAKMKKDFVNLCNEREALVPLYEERQLLKKERAELEAEKKTFRETLLRDFQLRMLKG